MVGLTNNQKKRMSHLTLKQKQDLDTLISHNLFKNLYSKFSLHLTEPTSIERNIKKLRLAEKWMKLFNFQKPANVLKMVHLPIPNTFANYKHKPTLRPDFITDNLLEMQNTKSNNIPRVKNELTGRIRNHLTHHQNSMPSHSSSTKSKPRSKKSHDLVKSKSGSKKSKPGSHEPHENPPIRWNNSLFIGTSPIPPIPQQPPKTPDNVNKLCQCISNNGGMWDTKTQTFCTNKKIIERSLRRVKDRKVSLIPVDESGRRIKKIYKNKLTKREREIIELLTTLQLV